MPKPYSPQKSQQNLHISKKFRTFASDLENLPSADILPPQKGRELPHRIGQIGPIKYARRERLMVVLDHTYYNMLVIR